MSNHLLEVNNLSVSFGSFTAVDDVSFHLDAGETLAIVGESGSGKTVTALSIMRLLEQSSRGRITSGEILLNPPNDTVMDLADLPEERLRQVRGNFVSMIFQEPLTALNPVFSVQSQLIEAIRSHRPVAKETAREMALEMMAKVRIPEPAERLKQHPHELSGGMRQRVMIAQALALNPQILIADEPTTALDVTIQAQVLGLIKDLQEEMGSAVIMITHDMGVVAQIADRVVVMRNSKVVETGAVEQIFGAPEHPYTKALLAAVPKLGSMNHTDKPEKFPLVEQTT